MLAACSAEPSAKPRPDAGKLPNIIFVVADDLSWNDVGAFGNAQVHTPGIDALARSGMRFERAYLTAASCSPSRASILTGLYPHSTGAQHLGQGLPLDTLLFSTLLREAGYFTAATGKWHIGMHAQASFERVIPKQDPRWQSDQVWVELLRERPRDRPFFFWLASADPHRPFDAGAAEFDMKPRLITVPGDYPETPAVRREFVDYYREISRLDGHVAALVLELERQGIREDTLLVFLADNGRPFPRAKATLYEAGVRMPLIMSWPARVEGGAVNAQLVSAVDLAPTVLEMAGLPVPEHFQGVSLLPTLDDRSQPVRDYVYSEQNWHGANIYERSVRSLEHAYIHASHRDISRCESRTSAAYKEMLARYQRKELEDALVRSCFTRPVEEEALYALEGDPYSLENLLGRESLEPALNDLRAALSRWQRQTRDKPYRAYVPPQKVQGD